MKLNINLIKGSVFLYLFLLLFYSSSAFSYPFRFRDSAGKDIVINQKPMRVVSLVPSVTEVIFNIRADETLKGITYHDAFPPEIRKKKVVGGFFSPSIEAIKEIDPDVIFYSGLHKEIHDYFIHKQCIMINLETRSIDDSKKTIILLGNIFNREKNALNTIEKIEQELNLISRKVDKIPSVRRKRVMRLMGRNTLMTPGDDSFQNQVIEAAGGIPPKLGKKGNVVTMTSEEFKRFNPQVIYGCGGDREAALRFFNEEGYKNVDAVKTGRIFYFPCDLTCRASTHTGYFVSWLSSVIYGKEFSKKKNRMHPEKVFKISFISIDLPYIQSARINHSRIYDFLNKTLVVDFNKPMAVVSTLEGFRTHIKTVGNHYSSPPCWSINHSHGLAASMRPVYRVNERSPKTSSFLLTGADMDNLCVHEKTYKDMKVIALVTAGVRSNALRMSRNTGDYYEPGTINIIILTNMSLSNRAMTRAIISATEAKTAALLDMDVRSTYKPKLYRATGTGTDNIIVVRGTGEKIDNSGEHTKMGELVARAVYASVQEAVLQQNSLYTGRNVFQRLKERKISIYSLVSDGPCDCGLSKSERVAQIEQTLLIPKYADFILTTLGMSDDFEKGLIQDLSWFNDACDRMAGDISDQRIKELEDYIRPGQIPEVIRMALNALINGVYKKYE